MTDKRLCPGRTTAARRVDRAADTDTVPKEVRPMTDRELLELAAKAAGLEITFSRESAMSPRRLDTWDTWNPLTDDGDALRLAVNLKLHITMNLYGAAVSSLHNGVVEQDTGDPCAATRRAIVRAAAEIARAPK